MTTHLPLDDGLARQLQALAEERGCTVDALLRNCLTAAPVPDVLFETILATISDAVFLTDDAGNLVYVCPNVDIIFGYKPAEVEQMGHISRLLGDDLFEMNELRAKGELSNIERRVYDKAGHPHTVLITIKLAHLGAGTIIYTCHDITRRREAERQLAREHQFLETIYNGSATGLFVVDVLPDGRFVYAGTNAAHEQLIGLSKAQIVGKTPHDLIPYMGADAMNYVQGLYEECVARREVVVSEQVVEVGGQHNWWQTRLTPLFDEDGRVYRLIGDASIITERKETEMALRESEARFRAMFEQAAVGVGQFETATGRFVRCNQRYCDIVGYSQAEIEKLTFQEITHPADLQRDLDFMDQLVAGQIHEFSMEKRYIHKDGSIVWVALTVSPLWAPGEPPTYHLAVVQDITDRKRAEEQLAKTQALLEAALAQSPAGILIADAPHTAVRFSNTAAAAILGVPENQPTHVSADNLTLKTWTDLYPDGTPYDVDELPLVRAIQEGAITTNVEMRVRRADGEERWILTNGAPVYDAEGNIIAGVVVFNDITPRKETEQRELALVIERERVQVLAGFIEGALHEFRTPLSTTQLDLYMLEAALHDEYQHKLLTRIHRQVKTIEALVETLGTMARLDSGEAHVHTAVHVNIVVRDAVTASYNAVQRQGLEMHMALDSTLKPIRANAQQLFLALEAVLDNAVRYTPQGSVTVRTYADLAHVVIEIADTGVGIGDDDMPHIFERFWRKDKARTTRGFGLGLPIAKKIITDHGGRIEVESTPGQGSLFRLLVPYEVA